MMSSNHLILCLPQSFPVTGTFPVSWLFELSVQRITASALHPLAEESVFAGVMTSVKERAAESIWGAGVGAALYVRAAPHSCSVKSQDSVGAASQVVLPFHLLDDVHAKTLCVTHESLPTQSLSRMMGWSLG